MTFTTGFTGPIGLATVGWHFWLWVVSGSLVALVFVFFLSPRQAAGRWKRCTFCSPRGVFGGEMEKGELEEKERQGKRYHEQVEIKAGTAQRLVVVGCCCSLRHLKPPLRNFPEPPFSFTQL